MYKDSNYTLNDKGKSLVVTLGNLHIEEIKFLQKTIEIHWCFVDEEETRLHIIDRELYLEWLTGNKFFDDSIAGYLEYYDLSDRIRHMKQYIVYHYEPSAETHLKSANELS